MTSHDVVSRLRRILKTKKIGHTGTLDPFATGVLVMLVGQATRLARFLDKDQKSYLAILRFGYETETGDREGAISGEGQGIANEGVMPEQMRVAVLLGKLPAREEIIRRVESVIPDFTGEVSQVPPMYSAKKIKGKKLYEHAREGETVERKPVTVNVQELYADPKSERCAENEIILGVTCSAGTYVRTLAEDIGRKIGIGCHLAELRRTAAGKFSLGNALDLEEVEDLFKQGRIAENMVSMNEAVDHLPMQELSLSELGLIKDGRRVPTRIDAAGVYPVRLTDAAGKLVAIGERADDEIQPKLVFRTE